MKQNILLLENIRSLNNVGAIFRSMDGAGWEKIILTGYTPTPPRKEISKTALGAEQTVIWEYYENTKEALKKYKNEWYTILAAEKNDISVNYTSVSDGDKKLLIMGNEVDGVAPETQKLCDAIVHIPMHGNKTSLNVAVAAGILLYGL